MIKKLIILGIIIGLIPIYLLTNRPQAITIKDSYQNQDAGMIIDEEFIESSRNVLNQKLIAENNFMKLFLNESTTQFSVVDKRNDYIWYSSVFTTDNIATQSIRNLQKSTFAIRYLETDNTVKLITNYEYSILPGSFEIDEISVENGFRINYTLKDSIPKGYWFPTMISKERFTEKVLSPFYRYDFENQNEFTYAEMLRVLNNYYKPVQDDPDTYLLSIIQQGQTSSNLGRIETEELFYLFYVIGTYGNDVDEFGNYVENYNLLDVEIDNEMYGYSVVISDPEFLIPMEIRLMDDHIDAKIVTSEIVQKSPYEIVSIQFLPYMGAANENRSGYIVIPEGSGGLMHFNNGKVRQRSYSSYFYNQDTTIIPNMLTLQDVGAKLPIFGLKHENNAMLAVVESGQSHGMLMAEISGKNDRFNKTYTEFTMKDSGLYYLTQAGVLIWNPDSYDYQPQIKYYFLADSEANYSDMASLYGKYIASKYQLSRLDEIAPELYLDVLGSYDFDDYFLFFPYKHVKSLTTYREAQEMMSYFKTQGIDEMVINYKGWFNQGIDHELPNQIELDKSVGNRKEMNAFVNSNENYHLYFDVDFVKLYDKPTLYSNRNISRIVGGTINENYPYDIASRLPDKSKDPYYLLKVQSMYQHMQGFMKDFSRLDANGVSMRNFGTMIYSDFHRGNSLYRYQIVDLYQDMLAEFQQEQNIMLQHPNDYTLPFVSHISDLSYDTSSYLMVDQAIPFYQIAIAGKISYSMPSININRVNDFDYYLLKALETGSNPKFTLSYKDTSLLIETKYNAYFSTEFDLLKQEIVSLFDSYASIVGANNFIIKHEIIDTNTVRVTYSNGLKIDIDYANLNYLVH